MATKYVYFFGEGKADGNAGMKNLLGGKGANLAEMTSLGIPVPPGFTITTEMCTEYFNNGGNLNDEVETQVKDALAKVEGIMGRKFGDPDNPLLVSVRSGARQSMPGMMDTVLNVGLCEATLPGLAKMMGDERYAWDSYRRLIQMYADVVMEFAAGIEHEDESDHIHNRLEKELETLKDEVGATEDQGLTTDNLKELVRRYKATVKDVLGSEFPDDPMAQLWGGIRAVFQSWNGKRAIAYRKYENIPHEWGTAVNVQTMVFGNMGEGCATGVAFTRDPATGNNVFYGEWLPNAQGEDVVAGIRTPRAINQPSISKGQNDNMPTLEQDMPEAYKQLFDIRNRLEAHYKDMQDVEFTIEKEKLWMLQTRTGKRNGRAATIMAVDMANEGLINKETAILRVRPDQLDELLHPMIDPKAEKDGKKITTGLPAGPGGAVGKIILNSDRAKELAAKSSDPLILVRVETSPEDVDGMRAAKGILTSRGGMTSHAALVARGWGKCCIVGAGDLKIDYAAKTVTTADGTVFKEGDWLSLNGTTGKVYAGQLPVVDADPDSVPEYTQLMEWSDEFRSLGVRTNADTPKDAEIARKFGAKGIGLTRTEHMFFGGERIKAVRGMILSDSPEQRREFIMKLLPFQRDDFYGILKAMSPYPVNIRLLDPPLHEFLPSHEEKDLIKQVASDMGIDEETLLKRINGLHEFNPMLGHRGCRLGITIPELTEMQSRAILEATAQLVKEGVEVHPEIMVPLVGNVKELENQRDLVLRVAEDVKQESGIDNLPFKVGTMIEVPRAAVTAGEIAKVAEFFSFGTNDLTQMGCGFSRDDAGSFLPDYVDRGIYDDDPFQSLDQSGVGELVRIAVEQGRKANPDLHLGICGEHGGDPKSVEFFHRVGLDYVSCSPFRVPIARFAAAQAVIKEK
ncbi:pyruvate, phosphate dikinase [bacterium]|nr:pyruvate, phosphate dikinase [bacterium]